MIGIIDYGMGNIHSVQKALEYMGAKTLVTNSPEDFKKVEKLVLPGVGAFDDAVLELEKRNLIPAIKQFINEKKTFLGICLGMQIFFEKSQEARQVKGLGLLKGGVDKFDAQSGVKVPQMGWNQLQVKGECPLLRDIPDNSAVYFCHSYYANPADKNDVAAFCNYGIDFAAMVWKDNIFGVQFHPEKSQGVGLKMLKNFVEIC